MDAQKAQAAAFGAVDGHHEDAPEPSNESLIGMSARAQDAVEHRDRGQVAGPHPEEGIPRGLLGLLPIRRPQLLPGRVQECWTTDMLCRMAEHHYKKNALLRQLHSWRPTSGT